MDLINQPQTQTTPEEQSKRFDFINNQLMEKYFELVWFARANPEQIRESGNYKLYRKVLKRLDTIANTYPIEVRELFEEGTDWQHGFNSGILAYSRFLAEYVKDSLFEDEEDDSDDVVILNGKRYIQIDGRQQAFDDFPMLDT